MVKKQTPKKRRKKGAKKKFFTVSVPLTATKIHLYHYTAEELQGRVVKLDLTKVLRGKSLELKAKVIYKDEKLCGELLSMQLIPTYIKRVMRRGIDYIEDSFEVNCKDSKIQIKPFLLTRKRVSRNVRKTIRNVARKHIEAKIKTRNTEEIFSEIMTNKFQKELSLKVKKIYPLALCEIRMLNVIGKIEKKKEE